MVSTLSHGVHQSSPVAARRTSRNRVEESERGGDVGDVLGPPPVGGLAGPRRHVDATPESPIESSIQDQGWQSARHLEIIPPQAASLASMEEKDRAAKQELRMIKLNPAMSRVKSPK